MFAFFSLIYTNKYTKKATHVCKQNNYVYTNTQQHKHTYYLQLQIMKKSKGQRIVKFVRVSESEQPRQHNCRERKQIKVYEHIRNKNKIMFTIYFFLKIGN